MVSSWKDGEEYELHLRVVQTSSTPEATSFDVVEANDMTEGGMPESEMEGEQPAEKPNRTKPALVIAVGKPK